MPRCQAKIRNGDQCKNNSIPGRSYCYLKAHGAGAESFFRRFLNFVRNRFVDLSLIGLLLALFGIWEHGQEKAQESFDGKLVSSSPANRRSVSFGHAVFTFDGLEGPVFLDHGEPFVSLKSDHGKLLISLKIRDAKGELIAELVDNEWKLNKNKIFDRNYTARDLEVRDNTGNVVLQVFNRGSVIQLAGVFHSKAGQVLRIVPSDPGGTGGAVFDPRTNSPYEIKAAFKYPSNLHLGECPNCDLLQEASWTNFSSYRISKPLELFPN